MPIDRPTFSESWYRVGALCPRLRSSVQVFRQHFRGQMWHVLQDPGSNQFFRLNDTGYHFVGLLDGKKTVAEVWNICNGQLGDSAPTQGEVIALLGQLYTSNLLQADIPPDAQGLFRRYKQRVGREVRGYLTNLLFIRIPLIDPDRFLERWVGIFGSVFSMIGMLLWFAIMFTGAYFLLGHTSELASQSVGILQTSNLPFLAISFWIVKIVHEFGHGFACKKFGLQAGGGEVHVMGIMFLIFMPLPYVDASSAWAFRSKWHRVVVGGAGMICELVIAAVAAIVWANVGPGMTQVIAYNCMFIASVTTLMFNANPLLRYDGYYILSDILEIPNFAQRSKNYLYYLVKKYIWSVRNPRNPANTPGEKTWFVFYGIASTIYRMFILVVILMFLSDRLPEELKFIAIIAAAVSGVAWLCTPIFKFVKYLATSGELARVRGRAVASTLLTVTSIIMVIGVMPWRDRVRAEGVVEPLGLEVVYSRTDGFVDNFLPSGTPVSAGDILLNAMPPASDPQARAAFVKKLNAELTASLRILKAEYDKIKRQEDWALAEGEHGVVASRIEEAKAKAEQIARIEEEITNLTLRAPINGIWISPDVDRLKGNFLQKGQQIGLVADHSPNNLIVRAVASQEIGAIFYELRNEKNHKIPLEIRILGRPNPAFGGHISKILDSAQDVLPSPALGYAVGGSVVTRQDDRQGLMAAEGFFEIHVTPQAMVDDKPIMLLPGQRVVVQFDLPEKPLIAQWWRSLLQLLQKKQ
ncbi:MAG: PqqD family peptide modification chaperone [Phycisphaerales bacterium]|jgi:putative peptide zinc metalloprotease protein|nr:PqqD family peptide modification chaperone [Phycisphaerales bacterium]